MTLGERILRLRAITLTEKLEAINEAILHAIGNPALTNKAARKMQRARQLEIDSLIRRHNELKD